MHPLTPTGAAFAALDVVLPECLPECGGVAESRGCLPPPTMADRRASSSAVRPFAWFYRHTRPESYGQERIENAIHAP